MPTATLSRSTSQPHPFRPSHRYSKSTSSASMASSTSLSGLPASPHAPIPAPIYPVRSQRISISRRTQDLKSLANEAPLSPTISGGLARRMSISSSGDSEEEQEEMVKERPLARRSESLPVFPPLEVEELREKEEQERQARENRERELASLPPNPKLWLPTHLSLYLTHSLSLPPHLSEDITSFIRSSRLSGRTFLRLRDCDFDDLGINVRWRAALTLARDELAREAAEASQGGRQMWSLAGPPISPLLPPEHTGLSAPSPVPALRRRASVEVEGSAEEDEQVKEEWKRSWRTLGAKAPGRVRGLRAAFEMGEEGRSGVDRVEELSEPASSPTKSAVGRSSTMGGNAEKGGKRMSWAEGWAQYSASRSVKGEETGQHGRENSAASVESAGGRYPTSHALSRSSSVPVAMPPPSPTHSVSDDSESDPFTSHPPRYPSQSNSDRGLPFPFSTPSATPRRTAIAQIELDLRSPPPSSTRSSQPTALPNRSQEDYQRAISAHDRPYALVRRSSASPELARGKMERPAPMRRATTTALAEYEGGTLSRDRGSGRVSFRSFRRSESDEVDGTGQDEGEITLKPVRSRSGTTSGEDEREGEGEFVWSPGSGGAKEQDSRVGALQDLFGLEIPKTSSAEEGGAETAREDGLATLFVPHGKGGNGGRKGSLVVVKKSQLAALHRRLDEVESLVSSALSQTSPELASSALFPFAPLDTDDESGAGVRRMYEGTYKGLPSERELERVALEDEVERVQGLECRARHLFASTSSTSTTFSPLHSSVASHAAHTPDTSFALSAVPPTRSHRRSRKKRREESADDTDTEDEGGRWPEGWKQLSGYVLAASVGIGIVAGEVVLTQLFGLRGGRR
ncbi:hypothetical protein JCM11641_006951 [Rhodosporidiobolus odoratus]